MQIKTGGIFPEDSILVRAIMLWPDNVERRRHYCAIDYANRFAYEHNTSLKSLPASLIQALLEAPSKSQVERDTAQASKRAIIAGYVLVFMFLMDLLRDRLPDKWGAKGASLSKAKFLAQKMAQSGVKFGDGSRMFTSDTSIEKCWHDYRSVAHLWSVGVMNRIARFAPQRELTKQAHFHKFMQAATYMQMFGTRHKLDNRSKHSPEALLVADKTWLIDVNEFRPSLLLPKDLSVFDNSPFVVMLKKYKA